MFKDEELPVRIADGQYKLVSRLGKGAMAVVYRAEVNLESFDFALALAGHQVAHEGASGAIEDLEVRQHARYEELKGKPKAELLRLCNENNVAYPKDGTAAVKVAMPGSREDLLPRFEAEWRQLIGFKHPNLIEVYGGGVDGDAAWYAMEVVEDILELDQTRELPESAKLELIDGAAAGLGALHENGLVHRDVKPSNFLVSRSAEGPVRVKVMDLGIAKDTASGKGLTASSHLLGTPYYMSPEQAGSTKRVDKRADIYSLGAALYSLVCGVRPYEGLSMHEIVGRLLRDQVPEPAGQVSPDLNPHIAAMIDKMMAFELEDRFQSMADVRATIAAIRAGDEAQLKTLLAKPKRKAATSGRAQKAGGKGCGASVLSLAGIVWLLLRLWP